ncbi:MAG: hypothetical protein ABEH78_01070 [Haloferacaceae archaeon]
MIRVLLALLLTVALAGVAFQAIERGRIDRTATRLDAAADRLARAASLLVARDDPTASGVPGARRVVRLDLPERSLAAAPVASFAVNGSDGAPEAGGWIRYRVAGARPTRVRVPVDLRTPDGPLVYAGGGRRRFVLRLVADGGPTVVVERGRPAEA